LQEGFGAVTIKKAVLWAGPSWVLAISLLHAWLNLDLFSPKPEAGRSFKVGFLYVTCHLTCPVNHFIQTNLKGEGGFEPIRFNGFPELKEAFISKYTDATFILAPLAMKLREDGVPVKIVYLGHRDGTALMVHKDSGIYRIEDLKGKRIAIPNRFSNQRLLIHKVLTERRMKLPDVELVEMPPPDMPAALYARAVDGVTSGEPFMGQTELDGYGRVLYLTKDVWPEFISCVLAVREDVIRSDRAKVQALVDGIARSGVWLDRNMNNRMQAAQFVSRDYYHQDPRLLEFVLSKPPDRVKYTNLSVRRPDFEEIERYAKESGILAGTAHFDDYCDPSFVPPGATIEVLKFQDDESFSRAREKGLIR
jgi:NitT/TauT family transport system substrate-binding protein